MIPHPEAQIAIRRCRQLSQRALAAIAEVSPAYVSQLEADGERNPSIEIIESLARALDVPAEALYVDPSVEVLVAELSRKLDGDRDALDKAIEILTLLREGRRS